MPFSVIVIPVSPRISRERKRPKPVCFPNPRSNIRSYLPETPTPSSSQVAGHRHRNSLVRVILLTPSPPCLRVLSRRSQRPALPWDPRISRLSPEVWNEIDDGTQALDQDFKVH